MDGHGYSGTRNCLSEAEQVLNRCTTIKNQAVIYLVQTQLFSYCLKPKRQRQLMVSVDYKQHDVNMDTQSPILPASNKIV